MIAATQTITLALYIVAGGLLLAAAVLTLMRMEPGPRMLDRIVSLDVFTAILIGGVGLVAAATAREDVVPVMLALALTGFFGAVAMARFTTTDRASERHIMSKEELEAEVAARRELEEDDDAPALYDPEEESEDEILEAIERRRTRNPLPPREGGAEGQGEGTGPMPDAPVGTPSTSEPDDANQEEHR